MLGKQRLWFDDLGRNWALHQKVLQEREGPPQAVSIDDDKDPAGELQDTKKKLEQQQLHSKIKRKLGESPKSKYNPGKARHKVSQLDLQHVLSACNPRGVRKGGNRICRWRWSHQRCMTC